MKKILFTLLTAISLTALGQTPSYTNTTMWDTSMKFDTPQLNLQHGVGNLIAADNLMYTSVVLSIGSTYAFTTATPGHGDASIFTGTILGMGSAACIIASHFYRRRGLKRLYWGANGITIPLNQE